MAEYKTFLFLGGTFATLLALSQFGTIIEFTWNVGNAAAAWNTFSVLQPLTQVISAVPILGELFAQNPANGFSLLYLVLSFFTVTTGVPFLNVVLSNAFVFIGLYMAYLFLKDRGI